MSNGSQWFLLSQSDDGVTGVAPWTPAEISTSVWLDASDSSTITKGLSGQLGVLDLDANSGINPETGSAWALGDTYRLVFASSTRRDGTSTNIADYNTHVQNAADAAGYGSITWKAMASTTSIGARVNSDTESSDTDGAFFLMDGSTVIADNLADLWDGSQGSADAIDKDEYGNTAASHGGPWGSWAGTWTGTQGNGTAQSGQEMGTSTPRVGLANGAATAAQWIARGTGTDTGLAYVYGVSEVLAIVNNGVDQWNDKSGNGYDISQSTKIRKPILNVTALNGLAGFNFAGNKSLQTDSSPTVAFVITVMKATNSTWDGYHSILDSKNGGVGSRIGALRENGNNGFHNNPYPSAAWEDGSSISVSTSGFSTINSPHIIAFSVTSGRGNPMNGVTVGNYGTATTLGGSGYQYEIVALSTAPSQADREKLEGYLAHKWGLEANLPGGHPYKNTAP